MRKVKHAYDSYLESHKKRLESEKGKLVQMLPFFRAFFDWKIGLLTAKINALETVLNNDSVNTYNFKAGWNRYYKPRIFGGYSETKRLIESTLATGSREGNSGFRGDQDDKRQEYYSNLEKEENNPYIPGLAIGEQQL